MPVKRRAPKARRGHEPSAAEHAWLYDQPAPPEANAFELLDVEWPRPDAERDGRPTLRELWEQHREAVLTWWVRQHPGTRPPAWWLIDAPEPRRRLRGTGEPRSGVLVLGLPTGWGFGRQPIDPADPPTFESQATYLLRLHLLVPGERRRIPAAAWAPEPVVLDDP